MDNFAKETLCRVIDEYKKIDNTEKFNFGKMRGYDYQAEAALLDDVVRRPNTSPKGHARFLDMDGDKVDHIMHHYGLNRQDRRDEVLGECAEYLKLWNARLKNPNDKSARAQLHDFSNSVGERLRFRKRSFYFLALDMFLIDPKNRDIFPYRQEWITNLTPNDARDFFRDLNYELDKSEKDFNVTSINEIIDESLADGRNSESIDEEQASEEERLAARNQELEAKLEVTESTLQFIRRSLDDMTDHMQEQAAAKEKEAINNFFTSMNSEQYGKLLDSTLEMAEKLKALRHAHFKVPSELMGMSILIKNLFAFIKGNGFRTIKSPGETFSATADDLNYVDYIGEPFVGDEAKSIQVISPGWQREDVIISRPVVREVDSLSDKED